MVTEKAWQSGLRHGFGDMSTNEDINYVGAFQVKSSLCLMMWLHVRGRLRCAKRTTSFCFLTYSGAYRSSLQPRADKQLLNRCDLSAWKRRRAGTKKITGMGTVVPIYTEGW